MNELFDICVNILNWIADTTGLTYKEANIWIFVIIHPIITLIFICLTIMMYIKYKLKTLKL